MRRKSDRERSRVAGSLACICSDRVVAPHANTTTSALLRVWLRPFFCSCWWLPAQPAQYTANIQGVVADPSAARHRQRHGRSDQHGDAGLGNGDVRRSRQLSVSEPRPRHLQDHCRGQGLHAGRSRRHPADEPDPQRRRFPWRSELAETGDRERRDSARQHRRDTESDDTRRRESLVGAAACRS